MKLLLIEDDRKTVTNFRKGIVEAGFTVDVAIRGDDGLHMARTVDYDLIVLDAMLPGRDGWSVIRELRESGRQTPVLFLTAMDAVYDRVRGLELGADDHLVKPFAFSEFLTRARSVLRRGTARQKEILRIADLELDTLRFAASRSGRKLELTPKEFSLLALLARHAGDVLSRTLIAEQVWDMNFDSDSNVVDVHVHRLRAKVDGPFAVKLIHTVRGVGCVLEHRG
jgi:two-component system, OmpR family, copper resistance phosphate regulon response regulator CusR